MSSGTGSSVAVVDRLNAGDKDFDGKRWGSF